MWPAQAPPITRPLTSKLQAPTGTKYSAPTPGPPFLPPVTYAFRFLENGRDTRDRLRAFFNVVEDHPQVYSRTPNVIPPSSRRHDNGCGFRSTMHGSSGYFPLLFSCSKRERGLRDVSVSSHVQGHDVEEACNVSRYI